MTPFTTVRSRAVILDEPNIDTDRIIPARFLTTTSSDGLGAFAFRDVRFRDDGTPIPEHPFHRPEAEGASIIVAGHNFGCGSSREHAAWALRDLGIRVVISSRIADIFKANAARNGLLPVEIDDVSHRALLRRPTVELEVDLDAGVIRAEGIDAIPFEIDGFMRRCLLDGVDHLGYLLGWMEEIEAFDRRRLPA
ncbi:MAG: 3-isopropylmalate dehydratase small subunit [Phycisphaerales bacterium]|nr:3-isopropylmalate dehydratase small subunit [Phycisphaerales bacterium]